MPFTLTQRALLSAATYEACYMALKDAPKTKVVGWVYDKDARENYPRNENRVMQNSAGPVTHLLLAAIKDDSYQPYPDLIKSKVNSWRATPGRRQWAQQVEEIGENQLVPLMSLGRSLKITESCHPHVKFTELDKLKSSATGHETTAEFFFYLLLRLKHLGYYHPKDSVICGLKAGVRTEAVEYYNNFEKMDKTSRKIRKFITSAEMPVPPYFTFELAVMEKMNRLSLQKKKEIIRAKPQAQFIDSYPYHDQTLCIDMAFGLVAEMSENPVEFFSDRLFSKLMQKTALVEALGPTGV